MATINLPKSATFLGNFSKGVKIYYVSSEIIFGATFKDIWQFFLVTLRASWQSDNDSVVKCVVAVNDDEMKDGRKDGDVVNEIKVFQFTVSVRGILCDKNP